MRTLRHLAPLSILIAAFALSAGIAPGAAQQPALVTTALGNELSAARDASHPMRYLLHKVTPRLTTSKELIETRDGSVARLIAVRDRPPTAQEAATEEARLDALLADPGRQRHRQQSEASDTARAMKVLRVLPKAFIYQDAGSIATAAGTMEKFTFSPSPKFDPPDLETEVLTAMTGELWVDPAHARVVHLEGHLQEDVDVGWGILGRLSKGGWIVLDQAEVAPGVWRVAKFQMKMEARILWRTKSFDTVEEQSQFVPVSAGLTYQQAIALLRTPR